MNGLFLYIDPGTGSMLFSILIGAAATLFFLSKAALLKFKVFYPAKKAASTLRRTLHLRTSSSMLRANNTGMFLSRLPTPLNGEKFL